MSVKILIVDDEQAIRNMLAIALRSSGFECYEASNAYEANDIIKNHPVDIVLLDWMMPQLSGIEFVRQLRKQADTKHLPVIMISAKTDEKNIVTGLTAGVDDYITKPFSPRELTARINAVLRRASQHHSQTTQAPINNAQLVAGKLVIDERKFSTTLAGEEITLAPTEFRLLAFFVKNQDRAFTRAQLLNSCARNGETMDERSIDVYIKRLRQALKVENYQQCVKTVHGVGYRFKLPE